MAISAKQYAKALRDANGFVTQAAENLNCTRWAVYKAIKKFPSVAEAKEDAREAMTDTAEGALNKLINEGNVAAIIFYLKTQGKQRGYVERQELTGKDGDGLFEGLIINIDNPTD